MIQDRANSPKWRGWGGPWPALREESSSGGECGKKSTHMPKLRSKGKLIKKGGKIKTREIKDKNLRQGKKAPSVRDPVNISFFTSCEL